MNVVIFAAGRGARLGFDVPKCLVEIGGMCLLEKQVYAIRAALGHTVEIYVVTGFQHELVFDAIAKLDDDYVYQLVNTQHETHSIIQSGIVAANEVDSAKILRLDGDLIISADDVFRMSACDGNVIAYRGRAEGEENAFLRLNPEDNLRAQAVIVDNSSSKHVNKPIWACVELYTNHSFQRVAYGMSRYLSLTTPWAAAINTYIGEFEPEGITTIKTSIQEIDTIDDLERIRRYYSS